MVAISTRLSGLFMGVMLLPSRGSESGPWPGLSSLSLYPLSLFGQGALQTYDHYRQGNPGLDGDSAE